MSKKDKERINKKILSPKKIELKEKKIQIITKIITQQNLQ